MKFNTVIIGGGLAGLTAGISLQMAGKSTAIISEGQNALHFFSGSLESMEEAPQRVVDLFAQAGISLHYNPGYRLMPMGTFKKSTLSLEDISLFPETKIGNKALIVSFSGYHDFFCGFLQEGLEKQGVQCRVQLLSLPELEHLEKSPSEMRSVQIARTMDLVWENVVREIRILLRDEDTVILPQVFGLKDTSVLSRIRQGIPAQVVFTGTLPPSVPGIRTQMLLKRRYELLGGTYLMGDQATGAHIHDGSIHSIVTHNLGNHFMEAENFILASGSFFSKGLRSNPFEISEPVFGLDVEQADDRSDWYNPEFMREQPYMKYGVTTDASLHAIKGGEPIKNLFAIGSILGETRPELGTGGGLAIRSALEVADQILKQTAE
ncbi:MAG: anaerobic glycerol-3-phosphate dehydrogenase subunit B [Bacteroidales bacterium]|nr:anaerobic glycerol-3-phosphate dehydrogenase subunit B [Bacteroidales bacterium]